MKEAKQSGCCMTKVALSGSPKIVSHSGLLHDSMPTGKKQAEWLKYKDRLMPS